MRIACLQFSPQLGDISNNLTRADYNLQRANLKDTDLLVLPELAFSGYTIESISHISPYIESTASSITTSWACSTALKYKCVVTVGYLQATQEGIPATIDCHNSVVAVNTKGETIANYRKLLFYDYDRHWTSEERNSFVVSTIPGLGNVALGIYSPYKPEILWSDWEFPHLILHKQANLIILAMAWPTDQEQGSYSKPPQQPDMETLAGWLARLEPLIRAERGEIIVVFANRCGVEDDTIYAGTSAVLGIDGGEVKVYGVLGRGEEGLLIVDTSKQPVARITQDPNSYVPENNAQSQDARLATHAIRFYPQPPESDSSGSASTPFLITDQLDTREPQIICPKPMMPHVAQFISMMI